jgi:hypothetical protein
MMFATPEQLASRLRTEFTAGQTFQAEQVLEGASVEVASACTDVTFVRVVDDTETFVGSPGPDLYLPGPVEDVTKVTLDGGAVGFRRYGNRLHRPRGWDGEVEVTYTHGFDGPPQVIQELTLRLASRMWVNPEQLMQKRRGDYSASFASSAVEATGLNRWELQMLADRGFRRTGI